ncbi:hypothetical protein [Intrasporangium flavum]|uniref:hypothetical protein n=1 Tax=Intrasporangium flavum TaxID=1428657 RepID=UPI00096F0618|nr:hypothetical protein [Intrasporangium flavum]
MSPRASIWFVSVVLGLIALVVIVGLWRGDLNPNGAVATLATVLTGTMAGLYWRERDKGNRPKDGSDE